MSNNDYREFHGEIHGHSAKAILFCADDWLEPQWVPLRSKFGAIVEILQVDPEYDGGTKEATIKIQKWLCKKNGW